MKKVVFIMLLAGLGFNLQAQTINPQKSKASFKIDAMGFKSVKGEITGMKGKVDFNKDSLSKSSFDVTIAPSSINTENKKRDTHLKSDDFFDIEKYTTIRFVSTEIKKDGNKYSTKGKLTILETTKEVTIPFTVTSNGNTMTFEGEIEINRFDYNLASESYSGTFMVGKTATVKITCVVTL